MKCVRITNLLLVVHTHAFLAQNKPVKLLWSVLKVTTYATLSQPSLDQATCKQSVKRRNAWQPTWPNLGSTLHGRSPANAQCREAGWLAFAVRIRGSMKQAGNTFRSICERLKSVWTTWGPMQPKLLLFLFVFWDAGSKFHHIGLAGNADCRL